MDSSSEIVIVANRLPVNITRDDQGQIQLENSSGGLATAMSSISASKISWVGWPGIDSDSLSNSEKAEITDLLAAYSYHPVFLSSEEVELYYEGFANNTVWPLFHYFQNIAQHEAEYWQAYQAVNQKFADQVAVSAAPQAKVWIQDYHLMLLPNMLRSRLTDSPIGFFLHIPFPSFEIFRLLPQRKEILQGMLGADVIGFHTFDYTQYFLNSAQRLLGLAHTDGAINFDQRTIKTSAYPIGIDYAKFRTELESAATKRNIKSLSKTHQSQKLILSVDRLDYSKGIPERLEAYRLLLESHPEYIGQVKLVIIAVPSRTNVEAYQQLRDEIEKTVSRINGTYGTVDWAPISYQFQSLEFSEVVALYSRADVMLVTPVRDGMNLVAKEYIACKQQDGVLILSEMAGAIDELPEALSVNPNDTDSIAAALNQALSMPAAEQKERLEAMQQRLESFTVQDWAGSFIEDLAISQQLDDPQHSTLSRAEISTTAKSYRQAAKRLIILDYDGTLRDFVNTPDPAAAAPTSRIRRLLDKLAAQDHTRVAIVSGRTKGALASWFANTPLILVAEHGAWKRFAKAWQQVESDFPSLKPQIIDIMQKYTDRTAGSEIEAKDYAVVWHHINVEPDTAFKRSSELEHELLEAFKNDNLSVDTGSNIVEVRPRNISKGSVVRELCRLYPSEFILCAGDDYTDEDMFEELHDNPDAVTIKVGGLSDTAAKNVVASPDDLMNLLEDIIK